MATMRNIIHWDDATLFAGYLVAYETNAHSLGAHDNFSYGEGYALEPNGATLFGYVSEEEVTWEEPGYLLFRLLKPGTYPGNRILSNSILNSFSVKMRLATSKEVDKIHNALQMNNAIFDGSYEEVVIILTKIFYETVYINFP